MIFFEYFRKSEYFLKIWNIFENSEYFRKLGIFFQTRNIFKNLEYYRNIPWANRHVLNTPS